MYAHAPWKIDPPTRHEFDENDIYSLVGSQSQLIIEQVERLMDNVGAKPTALVCVNDILAIIAISALRNIGYAVPDDVSVVGFDDISIASYIDVPLTTISQNAFELGKAASQILIERLRGQVSPPRRHQVPTQAANSQVISSTAAGMSLKVYL